MKFVTKLQHLENTIIRTRWKI